MKKFAVALAVTLLFGARVHADYLPLTNPGAEIGGFSTTTVPSGWTYSDEGSGTPMVARQVKSYRTGALELTTPDSGDYFFTFVGAQNESAPTSGGSSFDFFSGGVGDSAFLTQTGAAGSLLSITGKLVFSGVYQTTSIDEGRATLRVLDSSGNAIAAANTGALTSIGEWRDFVVELDLAGLSGADRWQVEIEGILQNGRAINTHFDSLSLQVVPSPSSMVLISGLGLVLVTGRLVRRRRKG